jgi:hypothetical protein
MKVRVVAFLIVLATLPTVAWAQSDWRFSLEGSYLFGQVDGYMQTPSGGQPGTTSSRRPKLDEIGINDASIYDAQVIGAFGNEGLYVGGQWIRMSGDDTLGQTLISQGRVFPAGTSVSSDVDLDWYRVGYRHRFALGRDGEWTLWPSAGAAFLDFHYRLSGGGVRADRSYIKVNAQFGLEAEWRPNRGRFALGAQLLATPPISPPLPEIFVEQLVAKYRLLGDAGDAASGRELDVFAGVAFEQIYYEDNQTVPNRVSADLGPMFVVGLNFRF